MSEKAGFVESLGLRLIAIFEDARTGPSIFILS